MGALVTTTVLGSCVEQPEVQCFVALSISSPFTARLEKVGGDDCPDHPTAMFVGAQTYVVDPRTPGDGINSVALQAQEAGEFVDRGELEDPPVTPEAGQKPYALGKFTSKHPGSDDICEVPTMSVAEVTMPEIPERVLEDVDEDEDGEPDTLPAQPAVSVRYKWSNFKAYVTAANTGTQWGADLEYTKNGCTAKYKVIAVNAQQYCGNEETGEPDDSLCEGATSEDFGPMKCDPGLLHCVLTGDFPSLN